MRESERKRQTKREKERERESKCILVSSQYRVATISRLLKMIGLLCKRAL